MNLPSRRIHSYYVIVNTPLRKSDRLQLQVVVDAEKAAWGPFINANLAILATR